MADVVLLEQVVYATHLLAMEGIVRALIAAGFVLVEESVVGHWTTPGTLVNGDWCTIQSPPGQAFAWQAWIEVDAGVPGRINFVVGPFADWVAGGPFTTPTNTRSIAIPAGIMASVIVDNRILIWIDDTGGPPPVHQFVYLGPITPSPQTVEDTNPAVLGTGEISVAQLEMAASWTRVSVHDNATPVAGGCLAMLNGFSAVDPWGAAAQPDPNGRYSVASYLIFFDVAGPHHQIAGHPQGLYRSASALVKQGIYMDRLCVVQGVAFGWSGNPPI